MEVRQITEEYPLELLLMADPSEKFIKQYLERGKCYIGEEDSELVGVFILLPTKSETVELINIAVVEEHQGKGFGKALVMNAVYKARGQGYTVIEVGTGNSSIDQLALYQKCGFRIIGVDIDFFKDRYEEEIVENGIPCVDMIRLAQLL